MPTYRISFMWEVPICIDATAEVTADSKEEAERLFMETKGDPNKMTNLDIEDKFGPWDFIRNGHPIEIEDVEVVSADAGSIPANAKEIE